MNEIINSNSSKKKSEIGSKKSNFKKHLFSLTDNKQEFSCQILGEYCEGSLEITYSNIACPIL